LREEGKLVPTSTAGSPLYETPIFEKEEKGDSKLIDLVVEENIDPELSRFADAPMTLPPIHVPVPENIEEICKQELELTPLVEGEGT
jgi:hypothetical protein